MKNNKAITLISLVITIIVLLILTTVSINLVINGGILDKAKSAVDKYSEEEIAEQIKMSYLEYENVRLYRTNTDIADFITTSLEKIYGEGTVKNISLKNKKLKVTIADKTYQYDINSGKVGEYVAPINYGTKTKETIEPGDDITIGTERFMAFFKGVDTDETSTYYNKQVIKAIPYYNLVKVTATGEVKQGPAVNEISTLILSNFATEQYWTSGETNIYMDDARNLIQQYVIEYRKTLYTLGVEVLVKIPMRDELTRVMNSRRNPVNIGFPGYWLCSDIFSLSPIIDVVDPDGSFGARNAVDSSNVYGVRPIIIIPIE